MTTVERDPFRDWPNLLKQVAELIGGELALKLAAQCGGIDGLYIPHKPNSAHPWAQAIGKDAFARVAKVLGGQRVSLPRGAYVKLQKRRILEMHEAGSSKRAIALECHVTERYVRRVLLGMTRHVEDPRQGKLFG